LLCHGPAKLREQPDGWLLDKLVFGVGVGHGSGIAAVVKHRAELKAYWTERIVQLAPISRLRWQSSRGSGAKR